MSHNKSAASEVDAAIEILFLVSDAMFLCKKLTDVDSGSQLELITHLARSYEIANRLLSYCEESANGINYASHSNVVKLRLC